MRLVHILNCYDYKYAVADLRGGGCVVITPFPGFFLLELL